MKNMQWVPFPNSHDSDGFTILMEEKNGTALFGAWVLMVQVASKCHPRGTLLRTNCEPHNSASLARMTRGDKKVFEKAIKLCLEIGWIEEIEPVSTKPQEGAGTPQESVARVPRRKEGRKGIEEKESIYPFEKFWDDYDRKEDRQKAEQKYFKVSEADRLLIKEHIPKYKAAQPDKQWRKQPATYLNNESWKNEIIQKSNGGHFDPSLTWKNRRTKV